MTASLRLVRRSRRASVVVDLSAESPRFTSPLTLAEVNAMRERPAPVPHAVFVGMYTAAWARAEHCGLHVTAGRLEPSCRYEPTEALWAATAQAMGAMVGCLGFAVPVMLDEHRRACAATWPRSWEAN